VLSLFFLILAAAAGYLLASWAIGNRRRWALSVSLAPGIAAGAASLLLFLLQLAGIANTATAWAAVLALLGVAAILYGRTPSNAEPPCHSASPWTWVLRLAAVLSLLLLLLDASTFLTHNPEGEWDAFAIWNVRARFLAAPGQWLPGVAPPDSAGLAHASHPSYPLLLSGFLGMAWMAGASTASSIPAMVSVVFALSVAGLLAASLFGLRGEWSALFALLLLVSPEAFRSQAAAQYADIPLSFFLLAWTALAALWLQSPDRTTLLIAAGFAAGLAPWTKNEGWPFALAAAAVTLCLARRNGWPRFLAGLLPPIVITLAFKTFIARGIESELPPTIGAALARLVEPERWSVVASAYAEQIAGMGFPYAHPVLLLALVIWALKPRPSSEWGSFHWLAIPSLALAAAEFLMLLTTSADIRWHTSTSVARLIIQPWPALLLVVFCLLRRPEESFPLKTESVDPAKAAKKRKRAA
jgi:hypothetical protein